MSDLLVELVADVLTHRQRVEERALLEDHAEVGAHRHHLAFVQLVDTFAVHPAPRPASAFSSPMMIFSDGRFPRPAGTEDDLRVPLLQREAHIAQHDLVVERQLDVLEDDHWRTRLVEDLRTSSAAGIERSVIA
ncbi:MAG: hypothetical protein QM736_25410 [Vicinamibacterales bacterium]